MRARVEDLRSRPNALVAIWLFVLVAATMTFTAGGHSYSVDEETYYQSTRDLLHGRLNLTLTPANDKVVINVPGRGGDPVQVGTLGQATLALPAHVTGQVVAKTVPPDQRDQVIRLFTFWQGSIVTALTVVVLFFLCMRLGASRNRALLLALVYAFGTWIWPHAKTFFSEPTAALFLTLAVLMAVRARQEDSRRSAAAAGAALWVAINVRGSMGIAAVPLFVYVVWPRHADWRNVRTWFGDSLRNAGAFVAGGLPFAILLGAGQWARFGSPFDLGYPPLPTGTPFYEGLVGLLVSPGKGLFLYAPIAIVSLFALPIAWRRFRAETILIGTIFFLTLLLLCRLVYWSGDSAWGPRYLVPVLPLVVALAAPALGRLAFRRAVLVAGLVGALVPAFLGLVVYFNAGYNITNIAIAAREGPVPAGAQREMQWFVPRWSPLAQHVDLVTEAVRSGLDRMDGEDPSIDARPLTGNPNDLVYWYAAPVQLDVWWMWWLPMGMPWAFLLLAPLSLGIAVLAGFRLRRAALGDESSADPSQTPTPIDITPPYRVLLGRDPTEAEAIAQPAVDGDLATISADLAASDEHRAVLSAGAPNRPAGVVTGSATAATVLPIGTESPDGSAIVGRDGWLFIVRGANDYLRQFTGDYPLSEPAMQSWEDLLDHHRDAADALGARLGALVIPDKLAVYAEHYPTRLTPSADRPVQRLLAARPTMLCYPLSELREAKRSGRQVYLRTDSHVTALGAEVAYRAAMRQLGLRPPRSRSRRPVREVFMSGDLGGKFKPALYEVARSPFPEGSIRLLEDNAAGIMDLGGHLGVRRVTRNADAPRDEVLVVFGDSYAYVEPTSAGNLGYLLASTFREVHFLWAPFCWDMAYLETLRPDLVLLQMAERFVVIAPRPEVDVRELAAETLRRKSGIVPEEIAAPASIARPS